MNIWDDIVYEMYGHTLYRHKYNTQRASNSRQSYDWGKSNFISALEGVGYGLAGLRYRSGLYFDFSRLATVRFECRTSRICAVVLYIHWKYITILIVNTVYGENHFYDSYTRQLTLFLSFHRIRTILDMPWHLCEKYKIRYTLTHVICTWARVYYM